jgi:hypothetical protein
MAGLEKNMTCLGEVEFYFLWLALGEDEEWDIGEQEEAREKLCS